MMIDTIKSEDTKKNDELSKFENMAWKRNAARRRESKTKPAADLSPEQEMDSDPHLKEKTHSRLKKSDASFTSRKSSSSSYDCELPEMENGAGNGAKMNISGLIKESDLHFVVYVKDSWFWYAHKYDSTFPDESKYHSKTEPSPRRLFFRNISTKHPAACSFYLNHEISEKLDDKVNILRTPAKNALGGSVLNPDVPAFIPVLVEEAVVPKRRPGFCLNRNRLKTESTKNEPLPVYNIFQGNQNRTMMRDVDKILDILDVERVENLNLNSTQELSLASTEKMKDACALPSAIPVTIPTAKVQPSVVTHQTNPAVEVLHELEIRHPLQSSSNRGGIMDPNHTTQISEIPLNNLESNIYSISNSGIVGNQNQSIIPESRSILVDQQGTTVQMDHGRSFVGEPFPLNQSSTPPCHGALMETQISDAIRPPPGLTLPVREQIQPVRITNNPLPVYSNSAPCEANSGMNQVLLEDESQINHQVSNHEVHTEANQGYNIQCTSTYAAGNPSSISQSGLNSNFSHQLSNIGRMTTGQNQSSFNNFLQASQEYLNSVIDQQMFRTEVTSKQDQPENYILSQECIPIGNNQLVSDAEVYSPSMVKMQNNIQRRTKLSMNNEWPISQSGSVNSVSRKLSNTQNDLNIPPTVPQLLDASLRMREQSNSQKPIFRNNLPVFSQSLNENSNLKEKDGQKPILLGNCVQAALQSCDVNLIMRDYNNPPKTVQPENNNWSIPQSVDEASVNTRTVLSMNHSWPSSSSFNVDLVMKDQIDTQRNILSMNDQWPIPQSQDMNSITRGQTNIRRANFPANSQWYTSQPIDLYSNLQEQSLRRNVNNNSRTSELLMLNSIIQDQSNIPPVADQWPTSQLRNTDSAGVLHNNQEPNFQLYNSNDTTQVFNSSGNAPFVQSYDNSLEPEQHFSFIPNRQRPQLPQNGDKMNSHVDKQPIHQQSVGINEDSKKLLPIRSILRNSISNEGRSKANDNKRVTFI